MIDIASIFGRYYPAGQPLSTLVWNHSEQVALLARRIALSCPHLKIDLEFLYEAAMLHDIGVFATHAPSILCEGEEPYLRHGIIGAQLLREEGLEKHALVCERHIGVGLTIADIEAQALPLPLRDMLPLSIEEKLICYADNFFSKSRPEQRRTQEQVRNGVARFGSENLARFDALVELFGPVGEE